ncbi:hypothetical protein HDU77_002703 [Chytriomyces hyalinus]|nr:hypothetical protein HDU77_002703 [Chytriomyces hyalinus]
MISDSLRVATGPDAIPPLLAESPGCFIIGAIGRKGAGKSTVLNLFANPYAAANNPRFTAASVGPPFNTKGTTRGVDVHSTTDGLVLVDSQPIHLPSQRKSSKRANTTNSMDDATLCKNSEKMTLLMFSVCHIILVVSSGNSTRDEELWAFLRRMEAVKYRADGGTQVNDDDIDALQKPQYRRRQRQRKPTASLESGAVQPKKNSTHLAHEGDSKNGSNPQDESTGGNRDSSSSDGSDSSEDGDEIENEDELPQRQAKISKPASAGNKVSGSVTANVESGRNRDPDIFFPDLIFVHNRAKPSDFGTNSYAATAAAVARSFRGSRLKFSSGIIHFGMAFPRIYSSVVHTSKRETEAIPHPNLWFLPSIPSIPSLHLLPMGPAPTAFVAGESGESHHNGTTTTSLLDRISVGFNQGDTNHVKTFLKDMEGVPARYTVLCDMLRDSVLEVPRYPFELPPPISSVYKTVASSQRNAAMSAADAGGAAEGGQMGKSSFVVGKKWFQISEKEWYRSAIGIWSSLEGER